MRSDTELARQYARTGSEEAFAEIARRHGATVYRACLRILGDRHAAEDASQAVFLVLVDRRRSLPRVRNLGAWLHGVARRIALMSRRTSARRTRNEEEAGMLRNCDGTGAGSDRDAAMELLDGELSRLPARQREAVVLRYLEDRSVEESARIAGCPAGTLGRRASDGLAGLRRRLASRGAVLSAGVLGALLTEEAARTVPETLLPALLAVPGLASGMGAAGATGCKATVLAKGAVKAMFMTKLKIATAALCAAAAVGVGTPFAYRALAAGVAGKGGKAAEVDIKETELGKMAASMKPGELKIFQTKGYTRDLMKSWYDWEKNLRGAHKGYAIISWSNDANWDPVSRQLFYFGLGHYASPKFVKYSADSNEWKLLELPKWADKRKNKSKKWPVGHTYDLETVIPEKRLFAMKWRELTHIYNIDTDKWSQRPSGAGKWTKAAGTPMEYFPEMKGLILVGDHNNLVLVDVETWKPRTLGKASIGIHGVMEYNPVFKVMMFGGGDGGKTGNRSFSLLDAKGKITRVKNSPVHVRCTPEAKLTCDPVSGEYLVQGRGARKMYAFHPVKNEWKEMSFKAPGGVAAQIPELGVVMFCAPWGGKVWLYKHKPLWPDAEPERGKAR